MHSLNEASVSKREDFRRRWIVSRDQTNRERKEVGDEQVDRIWQILFRFPSNDLFVSTLVSSHVSFDRNEKSSSFFSFPYRDSIPRPLLHLTRLLWLVRIPPSTSIYILSIFSWNREQISFHISVNPRRLIFIPFRCINVRVVFLEIEISSIA